MIFYFFINLLFSNVREADSPISQLFPETGGCYAYSQQEDLQRILFPLINDSFENFLRSDHPTLGSETILLNLNQ